MVIINLNTRGDSRLIATHNMVFINLNTKKSSTLDLITTSDKLVFINLNTK